MIWPKNVMLDVVQSRIFSQFYQQQSNKYYCSQPQITNHDIVSIIIIDHKYLAAITLSTPWAPADRETGQSLILIDKLNSVIGPQDHVIVIIAHVYLMRRLYTVLSLKW